MRRPPGRALLVLFLLVAFGLLVFAWTRSPGGRPVPPPTPSPLPADLVRLGTVARPATWPAWALERLVQGEGLRVQVQTFEDPGSLWESLAAGQLDLVLTTLDQFALAVPRHDPGVLLFPSARSRGSDALLARPEIRSAEDLGGRRIAYVDGTGGQYLVLHFQAAHPGLDLDPVPARNLDQALAWLRRGDVAAAAVWQPEAEALHREGFPVLWTSKQVPLTEVWVASRQALRGEGAGPAGLELVASAWFSLVDRLRTTPGLAVSAIAEETHQDPARLERGLREGCEFLTLEEARSVDPQALVQGLLALRNDWSLQGAFQPPLAPRAVEPDSTVDFTLLQKLALPEPPPMPPPALEEPSAVPPPGDEATPDGAGPTPPSPEAPASPGSPTSPEAEPSPGPPTPETAPGEPGEGASPGTGDLETPGPGSPSNPAPAP